MLEIWNLQDWISWNTSCFSMVNSWMWLGVHNITWRQRHGVSNHRQLSSVFNSLQVHWSDIDFKVGIYIVADGFTYSFSMTDLLSLSMDKILNMLSISQVEDCVALLVMWPTYWHRLIPLGFWVLGLNILSRQTWRCISDFFFLKL